MKNSYTFLLTTLVGGTCFMAGFLVSRQKFYKLADKEVSSILSKQQEHDERLLASYGIDIKTDKPKKNNNKKNNSATITHDTMDDKGKNRLNEELMFKNASNNEVIQNCDYSKIAKEKYTSDNKSAIISSLDNVNIEYISEREASLLDEYPIDLILYEDGYLADTDDNAVVNYKETIGDFKELKNKIKNNGVVYIKNVKTGKCYCVQKCEEKWMDVASPSQKQAILDLSTNINDN